MASDAPVGAGLAREDGGSGSIDVTDTPPRRLMSYLLFLTLLQVAGLQAQWRLSLATGMGAAKSSTARDIEMHHFRAIFLRGFQGAITLESR
jgi:hypothetical protein